MPHGDNMAHSFFYFHNNLTQCQTRPQPNRIVASLFRAFDVRNVYHQPISTGVALEGVLPISTAYMMSSPPRALYESRHVLSRSRECNDVGVLQVPFSIVPC